MAYLIILFFASLLQGMTGFGFSPMAIPLLSLFVPIKQLVTFIIVSNIIINTISLAKLYRFTDVKRMLVLFGIAALFTPLGAKLQGVLSEAQLLLIVSIFLLFVFLFPLDRWRIQLPMPVFSTVSAGLSGLLNSLIGLSGPPIIVLLNQWKLPKQVFRSSIIFYFLLLNLVTVAVHLWQGRFMADQALLAIQYSPAVIIGSLIGISLGNKMGEKSFQSVIRVGFILISLYNIIKAIS